MLLEAMSYLVEITAAFEFQPLISDQPLYRGDNAIAFALLEQYSDTPIARDREPETELQHLDHKLNLIIQMLGQMMQASQSRPPLHLLRLGADFVAWQQSQLQAGSQGTIELYLFDEMVLPIKAQVEIFQVTDGWSYARFSGPGEEALSAWERWVFRQHRRAVAQQREVSD